MIVIQMTSNHECDCGEKRQLYSFIETFIYIYNGIYSSIGYVDEPNMDGHDDDDNDDG